MGYRCDTKNSKVLKIVYKWTTESSHPGTKPPNITASPFLLEYCRKNRNLFFDQYTGLIIIEG